MPTQTVDISFILATHNRKQVVLRTLEGIGNCGLSRDEYEVILVDNASTDGTPERVESLCDTLIALSDNRGSCAKTLGLEKARGRFIVFLDDDSYPQPGSIQRMREHFEADERLGAAGFSVHLPDGRMEGGALPDVFLGCGVGLRKEALLAVGGLDLSFFIQAEEYDLAFKLVSAGWRVRMFNDLHVDHLKTTFARQNDRTMYYDTRNNLRVIARHLQSDAYKIYRADFLQRYAWLAKNSGLETSFARGAWSGLWFGFWQRRQEPHNRLNAENFEHFFCWKLIAEQMVALKNNGVNRVLFADLGKNIYAYHQAARLAGVEVAAIADDRFAAPHRTYRGVSVIPWIVADALNVDAIVVANASSVHGTVTYDRLRLRATVPVHHWFKRTEKHKDDGLKSTPLTVSLEENDLIPTSTTSSGSTASPTQGR